MTRGPAYIPELAQYVDDEIENPTALIAALAALLGDPETYRSIKGRPLDAFTDFVHELLLRDRELAEFLRNPGTPVSRALINGKWCADWRGLRKISARDLPTPEFDVCISFAGEDREVAQRIASLIKRNRMKRKIFYDDYEKVHLWGEELARYLHRIYSEQSKFCVILFSHPYARKIWTRHEYRAALTRVAQEQGSYVLPVAIDLNAVPDEFRSIGYWPFATGDERKIARAIEEKISDYIGQHYVTVEEITEILSRDRASRAILDGFQKGIRERISGGDSTGAGILRVLALIAAADLEHVNPSVRALIDLVLFGPGPVGDSFVDEEVTVTGDSSIRRALGTHGPFFFNISSWEEYFEPYRWPDEDEDESNSDDEE